MLTSNHYQVLARKYRPVTFEDMIGQEAMVTTLTNAFRAGRVAHAFMLTGVRGIGKTTTARLLARALNYQTDKHNAPSVDLTQPGLHCERIMASSHMDVLEMDAASRTGVDNMREMLDGVRYAPVEARYKVYIIDEVHMLSTGAFNALLKTLEEPPDHAKFIFATTEIRKVPITVLSRCQRFDLRRVQAQSLQDHLAKICVEEKVKVSDDGLALISRAAEGSVRDSLSLLDQAIVQSGLDGTEVSAEQVRSMLGLADRVRVLDLFEKAAKGDAACVLKELRGQYDDGADPAIVMRDLLEICHEVSRAQTLGEDGDFDLAPDQIKRVQVLAGELSLGQLTRIWQMLLKAYNDVRIAPSPLAAAEMAMLNISVAGDMPPPELIAKMIAELGAKEGGGGNFRQPQPSHETAGPISQNSDSKVASSEAPQTSAPTITPTSALSANTPVSPASQTRLQPQMQTQKQAEPQSQPASYRVIETLEAFIAALPKNEIQLASDIKRYVMPIRFKPGVMAFQPVEGAPVSLTGKIVSALKELTGELWIVTPETSGGGETINQRQRREKSEQEAKDRAHPAFAHPLLAKAKLIEIIHTAAQSGHETDQDAANTPPSDNIIPADFRPHPDDEDMI